VGWVGNRALPEFNHDHPTVREYLMRVAEYWIDFGIDGWRLDVAYEIETPGFWQEFRDRVKAINPQAYIVGEVWGDSRQWLDGTQFDGVMNYLFTGPTIAFTAGDRVQMQHAELPDYYPYPALDAAGYGKKMQDLLAMYPWDIQLTQLNLLSSHDTARVLTVAGDDEASVDLATLLTFTYPGAPSIYYGDEIGLAGAFDPDSRRGFPFQTAWNLRMLDLHKQLIALRHAHPALRVGDYHVLSAEGHLYVFARSLPEETLIVAVNAGTEKATAPCDLSSLSLAKAPEKCLYGTGDMTYNDGKLVLEVPPRAGVILG
jgi:glycosidase